MRSGIARILTDRRIHPKYYKRLAAQAVYPRIRLKFLDFPIFLDLNALDRPDHAVINLRNLKETSKMKNVFKFIALSALLMCFALFAGSVFAQTSTTGSIEGSVTDTTGAAVPGVAVRVTSPNLISAQTATTDDSGRFKILNLPPGRYAVSVEASKGFAKYEKNDVEVNLSRNSSVEIQLQPAGAQASVTITDTAGAAVDVSNNTSGSNVSSDQFS